MDKKVLSIIYDLKNSLETIEEALANDNIVLAQEALRNAQEDFVSLSESLVNLSTISPY